MKTIKLLALVLFGLAGTAVQAASVSLVPSAENVLEAESFEIGLLLSAGDIDEEGIFSGFVTIEYDPSPMM